MIQLPSIPARLMAALVMVFVWGGPASSAEPGLYGGEWLATEISGKPVPEKARMTLSIAADGTVSGSGGCNRFTGTADIDGNRISFPPFAATMKMCPPPLMVPEQEFLGALAEVTSYRLEGSQLVLEALGGVERVTLTREK